MFIVTLPELKVLDLMGLATTGGAYSAILAAVIFNAIIIPLLIPIALKGVTYRPVGAGALLRRNLLIYGLGGVIAPFIGIKLIDIAIDLLLPLVGHQMIRRVGPAAIAASHLGAAVSNDGGFPGCGWTHPTLLLKDKPR